MTNELDALQSPAPVAPARPAAGPDAAKVRAVAAQFESLLLGQMIKEMRGSMLDEDADKSTGFGGGPLVDELFSQLSLALSRGGGVGLGKQMEGAIQRQAALAGGGGSRFDAPAVPSMLEVPVMPTVASPLAAPMLLTPPGRVSSSFGWRQDPIDGQHKFHSGTDIAMPVGREVPSAMAGQVAFTGELGGYGLTVIVDHGNGLTTRYGHLSEVTVKPGAAVAQGQTIALSGSSGRSTGPHLHFEVLESGQPVDPAGVLGLQKPL